MTLHRSMLLPPTSLADIAIWALAGQGQYGAISHLADEYDISRQQVYRLRDTGQQALLDAFSPRQPMAWDADVPDAQLDRAIVGLYTIAPNSIDDIVDLLPILYGRKRSHGYIHGVIATAQDRAAKLLENTDLGGIEAAALDEMFWHNTPLLTGIDLDTGFLFSAEKVTKRTGPEWVSRLETLKASGFDPAVIIKDAGAAMAEASSVVFPDAEQRDDLFHAIALIHEAGRYLENRAYRMIRRFDQLDAQRNRAPKGSSRRRSLGQKCRHARHKMNDVIEHFDTFDALGESVKVLLRLCDPGCARLRTAQEIRDRLPRLADQIEALGGRRERKLGRYLRNRVEGLCGYLDALEEKLSSCAQLLGSAALVGGVVRAYQAGLLAGRGPRWQREERQAELVASATALIAQSGRPERLARALSVVTPVLQRRHRASSAIENLHSVLRPYIVVHKRVSQGFLDLFRFYWNTRVRRWGRHKGTTALELVTGNKHDHWLDMLGFPTPT
jgi:hypothetical protein